MAVPVPKEWGRHLVRKSTCVRRRLSKSRAMACNPATARARDVAHTASRGGPDGASRTHLVGRCRVVLQHSLERREHRNTASIGPPDGALAVLEAQPQDGGVYVLRLPPLHAHTHTYEWPAQRGIDRGRQGFTPLQS